MIMIINKDEDVDNDNTTKGDLKNITRVAEFVV